MYSIINPQVGGGATSLVSQELTTEDLNDLWGPNYWGKTFYAQGGNSVLNRPQQAGGFALQILRGGNGLTVQNFIFDTTSNIVTVYNRTDMGTNGVSWSDWAELVKSTGTYSTLSAGKDGDGNIITTTYATKDEVGAVTNVFKTTYSVQTTIGVTTALDDAMITPSANLIKKGDIVIDPNNTVALFQTDYDDTGIQTVRTIASTAVTKARIFYTNQDLRSRNLGSTTSVGINYNAYDTPPKAGDFVQDPYGIVAILNTDYDLDVDIATVAIVATSDRATSATTATSAIQDGDGNVITSTYVTSSDMETYVESQLNAAITTALNTAV